MGDFVNLLDELARTESFNKVVRLPAGQQNDGTAQEYVLRFFAFLENYTSFDHSVKDFLNDYCAKASEDPQINKRRKLFHKVFEYLAAVFPNGLTSRKRTTAVNLYEGVAVGAALALLQNPRVQMPTSLDWVNSDALRKVTTGATNNRSYVSGRIERSRDHFLAGK